MSELDIIKNTKRPNTTQSLVGDLKRIGIKEGDIVLVHSSLSSIGWVCGEDVGVIDALLEAVGKNGTICMPAHSSGNSDPALWCNPPVPKDWIEVIYENMPAFNREKTPTRGMGRVPECFRKYPGSFRSDHPQTSFAAKGKFAKEITKEHVLTPQFGKETPLGRMYELDAKVLLLGVEYDSCTCFHMAEALIESLDKVKMGAAMMEDGKRVWKWFEDIDYDNEDFNKLGADFERHCKINNGLIGNAASKLFDIRSGIDYAVTWLKTNRNK